MARKTFKKIINLCYDEDFPELHCELLSLEVDVKKSGDYEKGIEEILNAIYFYTEEEFPVDVMEEIQIIYQDFLESLEN